MKIRSRRAAKLTLLVAVVLGPLVAASCTGTAPAKGWSGGTVSNGDLYFGSMTGKLVEINISAGSSPWSIPLETGTVTSGLGCARSPVEVAIYGSPAVSDNLVYVGGYNGKVYAFEAGKNEPRWVFPRQGALSGGIVGSVVAANGNVYFGSADGTVYSLDAAAGFTNWQFSTGSQIWGTPTVADGTVFIGSFDHMLYALDAATGTEKWTFKADGAIEATPVVVGNTVYIGSFDRNLYAINATNGQLEWKFQGKNFFWAEPIVNGSLIYAPCLDGNVYILNADTGARVATVDVGSPVTSSPVLVSDTVVVATENGTIWAIGPTNEGHVLTKLGEPVHASLSAQDNQVFVHTDKDAVISVNATTGTSTQYTY